MGMVSHPHSLDISHEKTNEPMMTIPASAKKTIAEAISLGASITSLLS